MPSSSTAMPRRRSPTEIAAVAERAALVVVVVEPDAEHASGWLRAGADDVIGRDELAGAVGWRRIRFAVERRRRRELRRRAYSTDPGTGLPHRQQLVEHLSQLLALREREPAPMAVLALSHRGPAAARRRRREHRLRDAAPQDRGAAARRRARQRRRRRRRRRRRSRCCSARSSTAADADRVAAKLVAALARAVHASAAVERSVAVAVRHRPLPARRPRGRAAAAPGAGARRRRAGDVGRAGPATVRDARRRRARRRQRRALGAAEPRRRLAAPRPAGAAPAMPDNRRPMPISLRLLAGRRRAILPPPKAPL